MVNVYNQINVAEGIIKKAFGMESDEEIEKTEVAVEEEWIWVDGYKATDKNMRCRDYQYEIGKRFDMPEDAEIKECNSGFHLCKNLEDVFKYYEIDKCNRFWKVRALVRKGDLGRYNSTYAKRGFGSTAIYDPITGEIKMASYLDKLAAKSIEFVEELTVDEILEASGEDITGWTEADKIIAIEEGLVAARNNINIRQLEALGYNRDMAKFICEEGKFQKAYALGCQPDISMDTRIKCIFK